MASLPHVEPPRVRPGESSTITLVLIPQLLERTVVTASRTGETNVQSTPMAVSVLKGDELNRIQDRTIEHIAGRVPNVFFSQNTGLAQLTIRGIGTNAVFAGSDPSSAVYLDGVYLARPGMVLADFSISIGSRCCAARKGHSMAETVSAGRSTSSPKLLPTRLKPRCVSAPATKGLFAPRHESAVPSSLEG